MGAPAIKYLATKAKIINLGDIVELPESYAGLGFLEPVEEPKESEKTQKRNFSALSSTRDVNISWLSRFYWRRLVMD